MTPIAPKAQAHSKPAEWPSSQQVRHAGVQGMPSLGAASQLVTPSPAAASHGATHSYSHASVQRSATATPADTSTPALAQALTPPTAAAGTGHSATLDALGPGDHARSNMVAAAAHHAAQSPALARMLRGSLIVNTGQAPRSPARAAAHSPLQMAPSSIAHTRRQQRTLSPPVLQHGHPGAQPQATAPSQAEHMHVRSNTASSAASTHHTAQQNSDAAAPRPPPAGRSRGLQPRFQLSAISEADISSTCASDSTCERAALLLERCVARRVAMHRYKSALLRGSSASSHRRGSDAAGHASLQLSEGHNGVLAPASSEQHLRLPGSTNAQDGSRANDKQYMPATHTKNQADRRGHDARPERGSRQRTLQLHRQPHTSTNSADSGRLRASTQTAELLADEAEAQHHIAEFLSGKAEPQSTGEPRNGSLAALAFAERVQPWHALQTAHSGVPYSKPDRAGTAGHVCERAEAHDDKQGGREACPSFTVSLSESSE